MDGKFIPLIVYQVFKKAHLNPFYLKQSQGFSITQLIEKLNFIVNHQFASHGKYNPSTIADLS